MLPIIVGFCGSFEAGETERLWCAAIFAANRDCDMNDQQFAHALDVAPSVVSNMRACREAGPGILRFARLGTKWGVRLIVHLARIFCLRVIDDQHIDRLIARIDSVQVHVLDQHAEIARLQAELDHAQRRPRRMASMPLDERRTG